MWIAIWLVVYLSLTIAHYLFRFLSVDPHYPWVLFIILSTIFTSIITGMTYVLREVNKFFRRCDEIETKVHAAKTVTELTAIWNEELVPLSKQAGFRPQGDRIRALRSLMEGKIEGIREARDKE